jgi:hypothetical protein
VVSEQKNFKTAGTRFPGEPFLYGCVQLLSLIYDLRATIGLDENWRHGIFGFDQLCHFASEDLLQTM